VIDVWYDSGCAPHAAYHYPFEKPEVFEQQFPNDFISEAIDQTRGWFYSLLAISTAVFDKPAFLNCICLAHILDAEGHKMSKSRGNIIDPWQIFDNEGADSLRWYFLSTGPSDKPKLFSEEAIIEVQRKFLSTLWNVFSFFTTYAKIDSYYPHEKRTDGKARNATDLWLLSRLNRLIQVVRDRMDNYDYFAAATEIESFVVKDLSNWYIRINRRRFWKTEQDEEKDQGYDTLYETLSTVSKLIAPFTPFISEYIYQKIERPVSETNPESIHMDLIPELEDTFFNPDLEGTMVNIKNIVEAGRSARSVSNLKVRQPLSKIVCIGGDRIDDNDLIDIIKTELNVKEVEFKKDMEWAKSYKIKLDLKRVGPRFKKELPEILAQIETEPVEDMRSRLDEAGAYNLKLKTKEVTLEKQDVVFEELVPEDYSIGKVEDATILLDTVLTPELKQEAVAREVVRRIQVMRKDMDLDYSAEINVDQESNDSISEASAAFENYIKKETLARSFNRIDKIEFESDEKGETVTSSDGTSGTAVWALEEGEIKIRLNKAE
jgi:isoleucyl-tRNA synthetase